jgi:hypothetical protein
MLKEMNYSCGTCKQLLQSSWTCYTVDAGDGLPHDLEDTGKVPHLSEDKAMRTELGTPCTDQVRGTLIYLHSLRA